MSNMQAMDIMTKEQKARKKISVKSCLVACKPESLYLLFVLFWLVVFVGSIAVPYLAYGAGGDVTWEYGDALTSKQQANMMAVDDAGDVYIAGFTEQPGTKAYYTAKVKSDGSGVHWSKVYDNASGDDQATALALDSANNIIVTGYAWNGTNYDFHTIKYNGADGAVLWQHTFNAPMNGTDHATAIAIDSLNNVYVAGNSQGTSGADDYMIVKYGPNGPNPDGTPIWTKSYNGAANDHDRIMAITAGTSGLAVTGQSRNASADFDMLTIKYGFDSSLIWEKTRAASGDEKGVALRIDSGGNVIATGVSYNGTNKDIYTVKYNSAGGTVAWEDTLDGGFDDEPADMFVDSFDNIYITGYSFQLTSAHDLYTIKYNGSNGVVAWSDKHNSTNGDNDHAVSIAVDESGDLFVTGYSHKVVAAHDDFLTLKYNKSDGALLWQKAYDGTANKDDRPAGIAVGPSGEVIVAGWSDMWTAGALDYDFYAIKYDPGLLNPPTGLIAATQTTTHVALDWSDNSTIEDGFSIERKIGEFGTYAEINTVLANVTTYNDMSPAPDTRYYYRVRAYNSTDGYSYYSNEVSAVTTIFSFTSPSLTYTYDGADSGDDYLKALSTGPDHAPVVTGYSYSIAGQFDYYTVKLDQNSLSVTWSARYDSDQNDMDMASTLMVDNNNDVLVSGYSRLFSIASGGNTNDVYTIKYPSSGPPELWNDQYNGPAGDDDRSVAVDVARDASNNLVVIGYGKNVAWDDDIYVIKYLPNGTIDWTATPYDGGGNDYPSAVYFDPSGNVIVTGYTHNGTDYDFFTRMYDGSDGTVVWTDIYNVGGSGDDRAVSLSVDSLGDIYVAGTAITASGNRDFYTIKYAALDGARLWEKSFNGLADGDDDVAGVVVDLVNNDALVAGTTLAASGNNEIHVIRYDTSGNVVWERTLARAGTDETAVGVSIDLSGNVHVAGDTGSGAASDIISVQYKHDGSFAGGIIYDGSAGAADGAAAIDVNILGEAFVGGYTTSLNGDADYAVFKIINIFLQSPTPFTATTHYTQVDLFWNDNSLNEDGYHLERKLGICSAAGSWTPIQTYLPGTLSHIDSTLNIGASYCYRIRTFTNSGETSRWVEREVTTTTPTAPTDLIATVVSTTEVQLSWTDTTSIEEGFVIERCSGSGCSNFDQIAIVGTDVYTYTDMDVCESGNYTYRVKSYRTARWATAYSNEYSVTTPSTPNPAAFSLSAQGMSEAEIGLIWTDTANDETGYKIERCSGAAVACTLDTDFTEIAVVDSANITPVILLNMDEASWNGSAGEVIDSSGNGNHGVAVGGASTVAGGNTGRAGSFSGNGHYIDVGSIDIGADWSIETWFSYPLPSTSAWNTLTRGSSADHQVIVERSTMLLGTYGSSFRSSGFNMSTLTNGWHSLVAVGSGSTTMFYIDGQPVGTASYKSTSDVRSIGNYWGTLQQFGTIDDFAIYNRALTSFEIADHYSQGLNFSSRYYVDSGLNASQTYTYRTKSYKNAVCSWETGYSVNASADTTLVDPSGLSGSPYNTTQIDLSWTDNTSTETGFTIERCAGASCDFTTVDMTDTVSANVTSYSDTSACEGSAYSYRVLADRNIAPVWQSGWTTPSASASTPSITSSAPDPLTAAVVSESEMNLEWTDNTADETGFSIERCTGAGCSNYVEIATWEMEPGALLLLAMDELAWTGAASEVVDTSGNNYHGTSYNGVTTIAGGYYGRGGSFDGINDYVSTQVNINQSSGTPGVTMEAWVYPTSTSSGWHQVISSENGGYDWSLLRNGSTWSVFTGSSIFSTGISVDLNQWQHIVAVFDPATGVKFYKNGYQMASTGTIYYDSNDANIVIGKRAIGSEYFAGTIDDVAIYSRPLNASEVASHYEMGIQAGPLKRLRDTGLNPGTTYQYRVSAYKNTACSWTTANSNEVAALTDNVPAPDGLIVTTTDTSTLGLTWNDNTTSETSFTIERCSGTSCDFSTIDATYSVGPNVTSYSDATLCELSVYNFRVRAEKDDGPVWNSNWSGSAEGTTDSKSAPTNFAGSTVSETSIELNWTDTIGDETGFKLLRCMGAGCTPVQSLTSLDSIHAEIMVLHMDEPLWNGASNGVIDSSGNNKHGTSYSGATTTEYGKYGRAGNFDGVNDNIYTSLNIDQSATSPGVTMEAWVNPDTASGGWRHVISTDDDGVEWSIAHYNNSWRVLTGNTTWTTGFTVDVGQWQHIAAVFTPGTGITFYKNGVPASTTSIAYNTDDRNVTIGRRGRSGQYYYDGKIDEVGIYNRPLVQSEISQLYQQGAQSLAAKRYTDTGLLTNETYRYRLWAYKDGNCPWESSYLEFETSTVPPAPQNLTATVVDSTNINLTWSDGTAAETGFKIERCTGAGSGCSNFVEIDAVLTDVRSYLDTTVCEGTEYNYRIKAHLTPGWESAYSNESATTTAAKAAPTGLSATRVSEIRIDMSWTDNASDETGYKIERCAGVACSNFIEVAIMGANSTSYSDTGLVAATSYSYQVRAYKTASCPWDSAYSSIQSDITTVSDPAGLIATTANTTQIDLSWSDNTDSETGFEIERCEGAGCSIFALLAAVGPDDSTYSDTTVCNTMSYTYRVRARNEGLSNHGGGCWARRAPLTITGFMPNYESDVTVNYDSDMKSDFSDVRFYDETGGIELPFFISSKTDGVSATIKFRTLSNNNIYMYYGNPLASSSSNIGRLYEFYEAFPGTVIDSSKWVEIDPNNSIAQNNGLLLNDVSDAWDKALISQQTFSRAVNKAFYMKVDISADTMGNNHFMAGWEMDQTSSAYFDQLAHGLYFNNYVITTYEKGSHTGPNTQPYAASTTYEFMVVLKSSGAKYYINGGAYSNWTLIKETSAHSDPNMRIAIKQYSQMAVINEIKIMKNVSFTTGNPVVTAGAEEQSACYVFTNLWDTAYSNEASDITFTPVSPSGFLTTAVTDIQADLTWTDNTMDETGFKVERCQGAGCSNFTEISIAPADAVFYSDPTLNPETVYCYRVRANKTATCGWDTAYSGVSCDLMYSASATSLTAAALNSMVVQLDWTDNATDEDGYEVEEMMWNGRYSKIATLAPDVISFIDKRGVQSGKTYTYRVRAFRASDMSPYSNEAFVTMPVWNISDDTCY